MILYGPNGCEDVDSWAGATLVGGTMAGGSHCGEIGSVASNVVAETVDLSLRSVKVLVSFPKFWNPDPPPLYKRNKHYPGSNILREINQN